MLQLINPNAVQAADTAAADAVAAGPLDMTGEQAGAIFDLQLAALQDMSADALLTAPVQPLEAPALPAEVDAEHWLNSMLEQQAVLIEARETEIPDVVNQDQPPAQVDVLADVQVEAVPLSMVQPVIAADERHSQTVRARPLVLSGSESAQPRQVVITQSIAPVVAMATGTLPPEQTELLSQLTPTDAVVGSALSEATQPQSASLGHTLKLQAPQAQWGEQMLQSLRDSVEMQINQRVQNATIRLDPPELGSLEIFLSHEAGRLTVQLSAGNADVARLLLQTSDRLRQELVAQNFVQVNVQVSADAQGGRQHDHARQMLLTDDPVQAARSDDGDQSTHQDSTSDVLVTV